MEIVSLLGFADAIFRKERNDDRKCVCASQASSLHASTKKKIHPLATLLPKVQKELRAFKIYLFT